MIKSAVWTGSSVIFFPLLREGAHFNGENVGRSRRVSYLKVKNTQLRDCLIESRAYLALRENLLILSRPLKVIATWFVILPPILRQSSCLRCALSLGWSIRIFVDLSPSVHNLQHNKMRPLQGSCNCGRCQYVIAIPQDATEQALVYFDDSSESSKPYYPQFDQRRLVSPIPPDEVKQHR